MGAGWAGPVRASECVSHLGAELLADTVAGEPPAGAATHRGVPVGGVGFGTDDHNPLGGKGSERFTAATREVSGFDHQEIGRIGNQLVGEGA